MTHVAFFIVLGILFLCIIGVIVSMAKEDTDSTTFLIAISAFIAFFGLFLVPITASSEDRITRTPLVKNEYTVEKVEAGLIITYDKYYTIVSDYKVVNDFNDSTEVIFKEQSAYYRTPISLERYVEIQGETYPLIEIYK